MILVCLTQITKPYGYEISWRLEPQDPDVVLSDSCVSDSYYSYGTFEQKCQLKEGLYTLECLDSYGDGWNGGYIEIQGTQYCGPMGDNKFDGCTNGCTNKYKKIENIAITSNC